MIEINLLPEKLRRSESTPLAQQLTVYIGVALWAGLIFLNIFYFNQNAAATKSLTDLQGKVQKAKKFEKELKEVKSQIKTVEGHVEACASVYRKRQVWSKVLMDLKSIIQEQGYNRSNEDGEYLWLESIKVKKSKAKTSRRSRTSAAASGPSISLSGNASAPSSRKATLMFEQFMASLKRYQPSVEKRKAKAAKVKKTLQDEGPENEKKEAESLTLLESRKLAAEKKLAKHLEGDVAGGITELAFWKMFNDLTYKQTWTKEKEKSSGRGQEVAENLPKGKLKFQLTLKMKTVEQSVLSAVSSK